MKAFACVMGLAGVVAVAAGAPVPKDGGPKAEDYFPARKGDTRIYTVRISVPNGGRREFDQEVTVTTVERKGADTFVTTSVTDPDGRGTSRGVTVISTRGVDRAEDVGREWSSPVPLLRLPPRPGERVTVDTTRADNAFVLKGAVTTHPAEEVETPAKKYRAMRSEFKGTQNRMAYRRVVWFAAGVGVVKDVQFVEVIAGQPLIVELVLKSFTPAKP